MNMNLFKRSGCLKTKYHMSAIFQFERYSDNLNNSNTTNNQLLFSKTSNSSCDAYNLKTENSNCSVFGRSRGG